MKSYYLPGSWLNYVHYPIDSPKQPYETDTTFLFILHIRKLRLREDKSLVRDSNWGLCDSQANILNSILYFFSLYHFPEENVLSFSDSYHKCHLEFLSILDLDFKQDLSASFTVWIYILEGERVCIKIESSFMGVTSKWACSVKHKMSFYFPLMLPTLGFFFLFKFRIAYWIKVEGKSWHTATNKLPHLKIWNSDGRITLQSKIVFGLLKKKKKA